MYQRAQKIKEIITSAQTFLDLAEDQLDSLLVAVNALHLVDEKSAWVLMAASPDSVGIFRNSPCIFSLISSSQGKVKNIRNISQNRNIYRASMMLRSLIWLIWSTNLFFSKLKLTSSDETPRSSSLLVSSALPFIRFLPSIMTPPTRNPFTCRSYCHEACPHKSIYTGIGNCAKPQD